MKKTARMGNENGVPTAEGLCGDACARCRGCGLGGGKRELYPPDDGSPRGGGEIAPGSNVRTSVKVSLLAYGLPPVCLTAGILLGRLLFPQEWAQALSAILMLGAGFAVSAAGEKRGSSGRRARRAEEASRARER